MKKKEVSSLELTRASLEHIKRVEGKVRSFVTVSEDIDLAQAWQADQRSTGR